MTTIQVVCSNGHVEDLVLDINLGPYAKDLAEILAGTSKLIRMTHRPFMIGNCCKLVDTELSGAPLPCGGALTCKVVS